MWRITGLSVLTLHSYRLASFRNCCGLVFACWISLKTGNEVRTHVQPIADVFWCQLGSFRLGWVLFRPCPHHVCCFFGGNTGEKESKIEVNHCAICHPATDWDKNRSTPRTKRREMQSNVLHAIQCNQSALICTLGKLNVASTKWWHMRATISGKNSHLKDCICLHPVIKLFATQLKHK